MTKTPRSSLVIGAIFFAVGIGGIVNQALGFGATRSLDLEVTLAIVVRLLAVVGGLALIRGKSWARWLLLAWLVWHIVLGAMHSTEALLIHIAITAVIGWFLIRRVAVPSERESKCLTEGGGPES